MIRYFNQIYLSTCIYIIYNIYIIVPSVPGPSVPRYTINTIDINTIDTIDTLYTVVWKRQVKNKIFCKKVEKSEKSD